MQGFGTKIVFSALTGSGKSNIKSNRKESELTRVCVGYEGTIVNLDRRVRVLVGVKYSHVILVQKYVKMSQFSHFF